MKPLGGADFLFLFDYLLATGFYFSSLPQKIVTRASKMRNNWIWMLEQLV